MEHKRSRDLFTEETEPKKLKLDGNPSPVNGVFKLIRIREIHGKFVKSTMIKALDVEEIKVNGREDIIVPMKKSDYEYAKLDMEEFLIKNHEEDLSSFYDFGDTPFDIDYGTFINRALGAIYPWIFPDCILPVVSSIDIETDEYVKNINVEYTIKFHFGVQKHSFTIFIYERTNEETIHAIILEGISNMIRSIFFC